MRKQLFSIAGLLVRIYNEAMSTPEIMPEQPMQQETVVAKPEQPAISETAQSSGVTVLPPIPKPIVTDNNQVVAAPIPVTPAFDPATTLTVPVNVASSEEELEKGAHGPANLGVTWLDMYWLREVGKAIHRGWKVIFGQNN